jgi:nitrate reductase gamma subunit
VGQILPYITILTFFSGMLYRVYIWVKIPSPIITLFPRPQNSTTFAVIKECLLFPGLYRADKTFWGGAWIFHITLAFIVLGHFRVFTDFPWLWTLLGMDNVMVDKMSATTGGIAGIIIFIAVIFLIMRRIGLKRVWEISNLADFAILFLVLGIITTGNMMRFFQHFDLKETRAYFHGLAVFSLAPLPVNGLFITHFLFAQLLFIFAPFSKLLHLGGIFFSQTILKRS